jgi:hypothetical protein
MGHLKLKFVLNLMIALAGILFSVNSHALAPSCKDGYYQNAYGNCIKDPCGEGSYYDLSYKSCRPNCQVAGTVWDSGTQQCVSGSTACHSEQYWDSVKKVCVTMCMANCKPTCTSPQIYDSATNTCLAPITTKTPITITTENIVQTPINAETDIKTYKNPNLHNCLNGTKNTTPISTDYDCVETEQNADGSLKNAADKDYAKWSDELYAGKNRNKPVHGFYSKKLVRCDNATAPSEQCPIAVKAKFVITCNKKTPTFWNGSKCTEAKKIRTFYATYQAFTIPGQKPIKPNIVGDSTTSNTPATSISIDAIKGEAP